MTAHMKVSRLSIVLGGVIIVILGYVFIVMPLVRQVKELNRRIEVATLQHLRSSRTVSHFDEYVTNYKEFESIMRQSKTDKEEIAFFLKEIESFIADLNIRINDIKPLPDEDTQQSHVFFIDVEMDSSLKDFIMFLHAIATSKTMIRVERIVLTVQGKKDNRLTIELILSKTFLV